MNKPPQVLHRHAGCSEMTDRTSGRSAVLPSRPAERNAAGVAQAGSDIRAGGATAGPPHSRPREIEDPSNVLFVHRMSAALLAPALRLGIHPNLVSLAGLGFGIAAAASYLHWRDWRMATLGFACMAAWHVADGLDGAVARASGRTSAFGRFMDGLCDYLVFILVYVALALSLMPAHGALLPWALAVTAGGAHIVQAAAYERERDAYIRRLAGLPGHVVRPPSRNPLVRGYDRLQAALGRSDDGRLDGRLAASSPASRSRLLAEYRGRLSPQLRWLSILSANNRTIAIWLSCLVAGPQLYWLWEIVGLTLLWLWLGRRIRAAEAALADAQIGAPESAAASGGNGAGSVTGPDR